MMKTDLRAPAGWHDLYRPPTESSTPQSGDEAAVEVTEEELRGEVSSRWGGADPLSAMSAVITGAFAPVVLSGPLPLGVPPETAELPAAPVGDEVRLRSLIEELLRERLSSLPLQPMPSPPKVPSGHRQVLETLSELPGIAGWGVSQPDAARSARDALRRSDDLAVRRRRAGRAELGIDDAALLGGSVADEDPSLNDVSLAALARRIQAEQLGAGIKESTAAALAALEAEDDLLDDSFGGENSVEDLRIEGFPEPPASGGSSADDSDPFSAESDVIELALGEDSSAAISPVAVDEDAGAGRPFRMHLSLKPVLIGGQASLLKIPGLTAQSSAFLVLIDGRTTLRDLLMIASSGAEDVERAELALRLAWDAGVLEWAG